VLPAMDSEPFSDASSEPVYIGVNGFGIGGGYVHAAFTEYRPSAAVSARLQRPPLLLRAPSWAAARSPPHFLLPLSAVSEEHLSMYEASLADYLDAHPQVRLVALSSSANLTYQSDPRPCITLGGCLLSIVTLKACVVAPYRPACWTCVVPSLSTALSCATGVPTCRQVWRICGLSSLWTKLPKALLLWRMAHCPSPWRWFSQDRFERWRGLAITRGDII
jgi:hypothetical protein